MTNLIPIVAVCGTSADLATLPLLISTLMFALHFESPHPALAILSSWGMVAVAAALVFGEVIFDTTADRRKKIYRRTWPVVQYVLAAVITLIVVLALSAHLSTSQTIAALSAAYVDTGILKDGVIEKLKELMGYVVKKQMAVSTIPVRIGGAFGIVFLAYKSPYVALAIMLAALFVGCVGVVAALLLRNAFRARSRMQCSRCDYKPLKTARICPKCKTPTIVISGHGLQPSHRKLLVETAITMAWADGVIAKEEQEYLDAIIDLSEMPEGTKANYRELVRKGISPGELSINQSTAPLPKSLIDKVLGTAASIILSDGNLAEVEETRYLELASKLGVDEKAARKVLTNYQNMVLSA